MVGVEKEVPTFRTAALLPLHQMQTDPVQRGRISLPATVRPVLGEIGVIRGCPSVHHDMPDDLCPGELGDIDPGFPVTQCLDLVGWVRFAHLYSSRHR
jgi:hypothetical protein